MVPSPPPLPCIVIASVQRVPHPPPPRLPNGHTGSRAWTRACLRATQGTKRMPVTNTCTYLTLSTMLATGHQNTMCRHLSMFWTCLVQIRGIRSCGIEALSNLAPHLNHLHMLGLWGRLWSRLDCRFCKGFMPLIRWDKSVIINNNRRDYHQHDPAPFALLPSEHNHFTFPKPHAQNGCRAVAGGWGGSDWEGTPSSPGLQEGQGGGVGPVDNVACSCPGLLHPVC